MDSTETPPTINNFNDLIEPGLNGGKLESYEIEFFTQPSEYYRSMVIVKTKVKNPDESIYELNIVVRIIPENEVFIKAFDPERTFITENNCYTILAPALIKLQKDANIADDKIIDVFSKVYGARISVEKDAEKVDSDAALALENLNERGYKLGNRFKGYNYAETVVILHDLARFHAMTLALRIGNIEEFNQIYRPFLRLFNPEKSLSGDKRFAMCEQNLNMIKKLPGITEDVIAQVIKFFDIHEQRLTKEQLLPDTIFTTITHNDLWVNNIMIAYDAAGKPNNIKLLDFQIAQYDSLMHDLIFFLFVNVQSHILKEKLNELLKVYYMFFIQCFEDLKCPTDEYSYEKFEEEFQKIAPAQLHHVVSVLRIFSTDKGSIPNTPDSEKDIILEDREVEEIFYKKLEVVVTLLQQKGVLKGSKKSH